MKLDELLPALHMLPRPDKFRAVQFLTAELAQGEAGLTPGAEYPIWSPYEAHDAAATLTNFLKEPALDGVAPCLVSPKTNSPSPAQRSVHAGAQKAISYR